MNNSIADKLERIARNEQLIYNAGVEKGKAEVGEGVYDKGYADGFTDGKASVENNLLYATEAKFPNLNLFGKADVVINMPNLINATQMFRPNTDRFGNDALNRTVEHITVNSVSKKITNMQQTFYFAEPWDAKTALKHITLNMDISKVTSVSLMFNGCSLLEIIDGTPLDFSSVVDSTVSFTGGVPKLSYIRFAPNTIKVNLNMSANHALADESIQSIINGLSTIASGKTLTLSKTAKENAFTDEEWASLIATKPNWTISLV